MQSKLTLVQTKKIDPNPWCPPVKAEVAMLSVRLRIHCFLHSLASFDDATLSFYLDFFASWPPAALTRDFARGSVCAICACIYIGTNCTSSRHKCTSSSANSEFI